MAFHRVDSDVELLSNFLVAQAIGNQYYNLTFSVRHPHSTHQLPLFESFFDHEKKGNRLIFMMQKPSIYS